MNKQKIFVMGLTFLILIIVTPFAFDKLMNSKFNTMLLNLQQQRGIKIKEIKDKSSYLTTDRIFDVTIPGNITDQQIVKSVVIQSEVKFKNLPVTNVKFFNVVKKMVLNDGSDVKPLENNLKFIVITPDFNAYKYRILDNNITVSNMIFSWKNFNGIFDNKTKLFKNDSGLITVKNKLVNLMIYNIKSLLQDKAHLKQQQIHFDVNLSTQKFNAAVKNFTSQNKADINKKVNISSKSVCDEININNLFKIKKSTSVLAINGIDKNLYDRMQQGENSEEITNKLLKEGFNGKFNVKIKDIFFLNPLGFLDINTTFNVKNGSLEKIKNNDIGFASINASIVTTPLLIKSVSNVFPDINNLTEIKNHKAVINIKINKGNILINGRQIKSY